MLNICKFLPQIAREKLLVHMYITGALDPVGRAARRASKEAGRASGPAGRASEPAGRAWDPVGRASKQARSL